jgi:hypothetical protein
VKAGERGRHPLELHKLNSNPANRNRPRLPPSVPVVRPEQATKYNSATCQLVTSRWHPFLAPHRLARGNSYTAMPCIQWWVKSVFRTPRVLGTLQLHGRRAA